MNEVSVVIISRTRASANRRGITSCVSANLRHTCTSRYIVSAE